MDERREMATKDQSAAMVLDELPSLIPQCIVSGLRQSLVGCEDDGIEIAAEKHTGLGFGGDGVDVGFFRQSRQQAREGPFKCRLLVELEECQLWSAIDLGLVGGMWWWWWLWWPSRTKEGPGGLLGVDCGSRGHDEASDGDGDGDGEADERTESESVSRRQTWRDMRNANRHMRP